MINLILSILILVIFITVFNLKRAIKQNITVIRLIDKNIRKNVLFHN